MRLAAPLDAMASTVPEIFSSVERNFSRQVDREGNAWPPRKDDLPHDLLILTGDLMDAATGGLGSFVRYTEDTLEMGVRHEIIPYANTHQHGDSERNIPQREYFYLHVDDEPAVLMQFGTHASRSFRVNVLGVAA
jgi:phage gpG-like protein